MSSSFVNIFERKTFIIGLTSSLNASPMPQAMANHILQIMQAIIDMLNRLKSAEAKALVKAAKKEIKADDSE